MPPRIARDRSKLRSRPASVCVSATILGVDVIVHATTAGSKRGYDSDSSGLTLSLPHQWSDLLSPDLPSAHFDAALTGVLQSTTEMEKIQGLDEPEFQSVIDVLGQVKTIFVQRSRFSIYSCDAPVPDDRGRDERDSGRNASSPCVGYARPAESCQGHIC
jgi:hypothetical protein